MKTVSVQIVTYNSKSYISACLDSVIRQTYKIEKIIVVDNASTDGTLDILTLFADNIHLIRNDFNRGFASAHNQALKQCESDLVLVLNPDVELAPDYISCLVKVFESYEDVGSSTGKLLLSERPDTIDSTGLIMKKNRRAFDRGAGDSMALWGEPGYIFGTSGAAAMYRRTMIEDISINNEFFDEDFFIYKEDVDVAWRAQIFGWKSFYEPNATAIHRRGWKQGSRYSQSLFIRQHSYINRYYMILKNESIKYFFPHLLFLIPYEIMSFIYFVLREPRVLSAWTDFFKLLPENLSKRKYIAMNKKAKDADIYSFFK